MRNAIVIAGLLLCAVGARGQTTFSPGQNAICASVLESQYCSGVTDGTYSLDFNGATGAVAVRKDGALVLTATDLVLTVTKLSETHTGVGNRTIRTFELVGTFSGGHFALYMVEQDWVGAGRYGHHYFQSFIAAADPGPGLVELD